MADDGYHDRWISCTAERIEIRGYYFPWGTKRIPYGKVRSVRRVDMGFLSGKWRIWGTANPRYWASLDPRRPTKQVGFVLDLGRFVRPFVTPDDPDAFGAAVAAHTAFDPAAPASGSGPII